MWQSIQVLWQFSITEFVIDSIYVSVKLMSARIEVSDKNNIQKKKKYSNIFIKFWQNIILEREGRVFPHLFWREYRTKKTIRFGK